MINIFCNIRENASSAQEPSTNKEQKKRKFYYGGPSPIKYLLEHRNYELTEGNLKELNIHFQNGRNF